MKLAIGLIRLLRNMVVFLAELARYDKFSWRTNACKIDNCSIDDSVVLYGNYTLRKVSIGYATYVSSNATILNTTIGKFCSVGPNLVCGWGIHPINGISTHPAFYSSIKKSKVTFCSTDQAVEHRPIQIGNDVFIGANVTILDGVIIGDGAVIGAGAVVSKNVPPYAIAVGCPARVIKYRFPPEQIDSLLHYQWWNKENALELVKKNFYSVKKFLKEVLAEQD